MRGKVVFKCCKKSLCCVAEEGRVRTGGGGGGTRPNVRGMTGRYMVWEAVQNMVWGG